MKRDMEWDNKYETIEYEKKYLIVPPLPFQKDNFPHHKIKQRYIKHGNNPVQRLRNRDNISYTLTKKYTDKRVVGKIEHEIDISYDQFVLLKAYRIPSIYGCIRKSRYIIPYGNYTIELDCFEENMDNIMIAEVEFTSLDNMISFVPPDRFGPEITSIISNKKLYFQWPSFILRSTKHTKQKQTIKHQPTIIKLIKHMSKIKKKLTLLKDTIV